MADKLYLHTCIRCGGTFESASVGKLLCPECTARNKKESSERYRKKKKALSHDVIPIRKMVHIIEQYNASHGTSYTYGKFVQLINSGHIDIQEVLN